MTDDKPEPINALADVRAAHNVVAAVSSVEAAREAILALEQAGIPAGEIALLGAQAAPDVTAREPGPSEDISKSSVGGATTGAVGGGLAGALASVMIPGLGPAVAAGLWALGGAATGAVVGGVSATGDSEAWRQTYQVVESGNFAVGVHTDDPETADRAESTLKGLEPLSVNRFGG